MAIPTARQKRTLSFNRSVALGVLALLVPFSSLADGPSDSFVPFVIPARTNPESPLTMATQPIPSDGPRVEIRDGHFVRDGNPFRAWGVNFSFGANLPDENDARDTAARLAAAGVNSVRIHHLDTRPYSEGIWDKDGKSIAEEALARLDRLITELAEQGIVVNLNLHVGHAHSHALGLPEPNTDFDKIVGIFTPELIAAQKDYARELLTHANPLRGRTYADDPAVAFVEISNEDSFFMWNGEEKLRTLPSFYRDILQSQFNGWLRGRYKNTTGLRGAWGQGASTLGRNLLDNGDFRRSGPAADTAPTGWVLEQHGSARATLKIGDASGTHVLRIQIDALDDTGWHLQLHQKDLTLRAGEYYTLRFRARGDSARSIRCVAGMAHSPWNDLGLRRSVDLAPDWTEFRLAFEATASDDDARVVFSFGDSTVPWDLADVKLRPGGRVGLDKGERLENGSVVLFGSSETRQRSLDRLRFLGETEKAYFDVMRRFVREDCGYKGPVTGTIVFSPLGLYAQSDMDFIDAHAYWQHPKFPGWPWDPANWIVEQEAMTDHPDSATLFRLALERLAGKPFTVTEYNHPAPNDFQAECVPMIASFAASQDWDGVWVYSYKHGRDNWEADHFESFFDIYANPAKWGFMRAGAAIFGAGGISPLADSRLFDLTEGKASLPALTALQMGFSESRLLAMMMEKGISPAAFVQERFAQTLGGELLPVSRAGHDGTRVLWDIAKTGSADAKAKGWYVIQSGGGAVFTGHAGGFAPRTGNALSVRAPDFAAVVFVSLDGKPLDNCRRALVAACGRCENTGMGFSPDRRTVGRQWGSGPVRIEAVDATLSLPPGRWTCQALGPDGMPKQDVAVSGDADAPALILSPKYGTMWYLLNQADRSRP